MIWRSGTAGNAGYLVSRKLSFFYRAESVTCRQVVSILQWNRATDEVFKSYRRGYKKRFVRMKAGTMVADDFLRFEKTKEIKAECAAGKLDREQFKDWLRET